MSFITFNIEQIKAIVFDLDNTLVTSDIDFTELRKQIGCSHDDDVLSYVEQLKCDERKLLANKLILEHELEDARHSDTLPGCHSLIQFIHSNNMKTAIITRNCEQAAKTKAEHNNLNIPTIISREHFPPKPAPDSLFSLAQQWNLKTHQILYVGDYIYDLQAAFNASMPSCLVTHGEEKLYSSSASLVVEHLHDIEQLFDTHYYSETSRAS